MLAASAFASSVAAAALQLKRGSATNALPKTARMRSSSCAPARARIARRRDGRAAPALWSSRVCALFASAVACASSVARVGASSPLANSGIADAMPKAPSFSSAARSASARRGRAFRDERVQRTVRARQRGLGLLRARFEFGQVDRAGRCARRRVEVFGIDAARIAEQRARRPRLLQQIGERQSRPRRDRSAAPCCKRRPGAPPKPFVIARAW